MISEQQYQIIREITRQYNLKSIGIFGSYARGEQTPGSDLDMLIESNEKLNLLDIISLEQELSQGLGIHVDVLTPGAIHPEIKKHIERDLIFI